jgi:hypothetical protein
MNANYFRGTARRGFGSTILLVGGAAWLLLGASAGAAELDGATLADEPAAHEVYNRMIEAMHQARSLSYTGRFEREAGGGNGPRARTGCG